jgi:hypothetical protein
MDNTTSQSPPISAADAERIADSLAAALENRRQRAERSVINSFARQNNLTPEALAEFLRQREERLGDPLPDGLRETVDRRLRAADDRLIHAEIRDVGAQLGLIDPDAAFALMDKSAVSVADDGTVLGVRESLDELLRHKPYLAANASRSTGRAGNFPRGNEPSDYASRLALARRDGNNTLAAAIISEAAAKGILLR